MGKQKCHFFKAYLFFQVFAASCSDSLWCVELYITVKIHTKCTCVIMDSDEEEIEAMCFFFFLGE